MSHNLWLIKQLGLISRQLICKLALIASEDTSRSICMSFWTPEKAIFNIWNLGTDFIRFMFNERTCWNNWFAKDEWSVPCNRWNSCHQIRFRLFSFCYDSMRLFPSAIIAINTLTVIDAIFCVGKSKLESIVANSCAHATIFNAIFSFTFALPWSKVDCTQIGAVSTSWWCCCCWCSNKFCGL